MKTPKFYALRIHQRIQGTIITICHVETWQILTTKREADRAANAYNRKHYYNEERREFFADKWVAPVLL